MAKSIKRKRIYSAEWVRAQLKRDFAASGLTQRAYAKRVRESEESISLALTGRRNPSRRLTRRLGYSRVIAYVPRAES
jgi:hypothetical protein